MKYIIYALALLTTALPIKAQNNDKTISELIAQYKYETAYLSANDSVNLAYIDEGQGDQTLIFVHGLGTYLPSWYPTIEALKSDYRCIAVDLPGYGRSTIANVESTMDAHAQVLITLIKELNLEKLTLVGHSMGAQIALKAALKRPELIGQLILLAPAGFETFTPTQATWYKNVFTLPIVEDADEQQIRAGWTLNFHEMPEAVEFMIQDRIKMKDASDFAAYAQNIIQAVHGMLDAPVYDQLNTLKHPTLVVYGANDALIPNRAMNPNLTTLMVAEAGANEMPNATLEIIPECGHFVVYDQPEKLNLLIKEFLERQ